MNNKANNKRGSNLESLLHSEHIVKIEKLAVGGSGVGRVLFADQKIVVFIPKSAPEDVLKIKIVSVEKNFLTGEIIKIEQAGPGRRAPECKYFDQCGGCPWQHIDEHTQLAQKELILRDLLHKFLPGTDYELSETVTTEHNFEYRNRIQLKQIGTKLGYFKPETHDLVDIDDCLIAEKPLREWFKDRKNKIKPSDKLKKHELKINSQDKVEFYTIGSKSEGLSFAQVNRHVNKLLVDKVVQLTTTIKSFDSLTEFYAGSGNFTFPLAEKYNNLQIDAIELNSDLTATAVTHIKNQKWHNRIKFYTTKSEIFALRNELSRQLIILDPPRTGCEKTLIQKIAQAKPNHILYISCHPVSLARDLQYLRSCGYNFKISHLQIFEMFPQTDHFETLCLIEKI